VVVLQHQPHLACKNPYSDGLVSESKLVFGFSSSQFRPGVAAFCDLLNGRQQEMGR
jgi:hypothetical protein